MADEDADEPRQEPVNIAGSPKLDVHIATEPRLEPVNIVGGTSNLDVYIATEGSAKGDFVPPGGGFVQVIGPLSNPSTKVAETPPTAPGEPTPPTFGFSLTSGQVNEGFPVGGIEVRQLPVDVGPDEEPDVTKDESFVIFRTRSLIIRILRAIAVGNILPAVDGALMSLEGVERGVRNTLTGVTGPLLDRVLRTIGYEREELRTRRRQLLVRGEGEEPEESPKTALVPASTSSVEPYRGHPRSIERGEHPVASRLLDNTPRLSMVSQERVNGLVRHLSDLDTHTPILEQLAQLAIEVELDEFIPSGLLETVGDLHSTWRVDGIHPDAAETVFVLLTRAKKRLDRTYAVGLRSIALLGPILFVLAILKAPVLAFTIVFGTFALGAATGAHVVQLLNHRRREIEEMCGTLKPLLPPLKHRSLHARLNELKSGDESK